MSRVVFIGVIILILSQGSGFVWNNLNPGWGLDRPNPFQPPDSHLRYPPVSTLEMTRPSSMPHQEFIGLTREERRALPHSNHMKIIHERSPELEVGFWQSKFKVGDSDAIHDLPYTIKNNGGTKTEKTDDNTLKMM